MKPFKHLYKLGKLRASRRALRHYALYRVSRLGGNVDEQALIDFHLYETTGQLPEACKNFTQFSMTNGKWALKIAQDQIIEDIQAGNACKAEFYPSRKYYSKSSWFWVKALNTITASSGFWTNK